MRTVYLGTSDFAAAVLQRLASSDHRPELVITRPDRPRGRGRRLASPPVADVARSLGIELAQPEDVNADRARERIARTRPEVICICAFGALIKEPLLSEHAMLNAHPSLLPRWRGAAPIERAIEAGDSVTGVSIMRPTADLDAGPVCLRREEPITPDDDYGTLSARLAALAGELLVSALDLRPPFHEQPAEGVTIAQKITQSDRRLNPEERPDELERRIRALRPHVGTYVDLPGGSRLGVSSARPARDTAPPGELAAEGGRLLFGCAGGALELLEVRPAGGRSMDGGAYLRGHSGALAR